MIDILFVCVLGSVTKEIKVDKAADCRVLIDTKVVGSAKHNPEFCPGLAAKVKQDMEKKGYKCNEKVPVKPV